MISTLLSSPTLMNFIAMGAPAPGQDPGRSMAGMLIPMIAIFGIFYLIIIRPQKKQQQELQKMLDAIQPGDKVLTTAGILGIVDKVREKHIVVKIADNTKVEMVRSGIQQVLKDEEKEAKAS